MAKDKARNELAKLLAKLSEPGEYTGELAKRLPRRPEYIGTLRNSTPPALSNQYAKGLLLLLAHYDIQPTNPDCWFILALELAKAHVPRFQVTNVGRPRKMMNNLSVIMQEAGLHQAKQQVKRGRPVKKKPDPEKFVAFVEAHKKELSAKSHGLRITDKIALKTIIEKVAKEGGKSVNEAVAKDLPYFQKRLSEARKKIPNNQK